MELFRTNDFYIFVNSEYSLWWDRQTGAFIPKTGWDLADADDPICMGLCEGLIGKIEHSSVFDPRLLLIRESVPVGKLHGEDEVYKIKSVTFVPLGPENIDINLQSCPKHKSNSSTSKKSPNSIFDIQKNTTLTKTWGTLKSAGNTIRNTTQHAAAMATGLPKRRDSRDKERFEKQIMEEFHKIFTDTNSFYFSKTTDLTNSLQRLCNLEKNGLIDRKALWKTVDDRFFWNKHMLKDLIELNNPLCDPWIMPIIQGYIQIERCNVDLTVELQEKSVEIFTLCILSRRSRFRAGTRYKRRGVDENGECANYVETEQLVSYQSHEVSFVQIRGSVPVYWSQPGYKYRPPPRIDKGEAETLIAFEKHFDTEIQRYGPVCAINLIDQTGKEKIIFDSYSNYVLKYNSPFITYVTFDFHEYCRGMHFENVSILINALADIIKDMNYCWRDKQGHICSQNSIFRVNCIDCLDRTNVVQTAIGKAVMEIQFCKLGLISPEGNMPNNLKSTFQLLWANNGDTISRQYAGTNALKGDYTRTGERKFTGIMKDGMNSANRYYKSHFRDALRQCCLDIMLGERPNELEVQGFWSGLRTLSCIASELVPPPSSYTPHLALEQEYEIANLVLEFSRYYLSRFKDSTRQGTIDLMLGNVVSDDLFNESKTLQFDEDNAATAEHVKLLIEDCKKMLINQPELVMGSWGLINADPCGGDPNETEMDSILILTKDSYFVADYDDQVDKVTKYQKVSLQDITLLEAGIPETGTSLFKINKQRFCIRINYKVDGADGYYHMFRSTNLRFFNNMAVLIKNEEEEIESMKSICEAFLVALDICGLPSIPFISGKCLDRRKSKVLHSEDGHTRGIYLDIAGFPQITRNVSEGQLTTLKNVGSKALSNMSQQFSKLNKIGNSFKKNRNKQTPSFIIGKADKSDSSSDSEEEYEHSIFQPSIETGTTLQFATDSSSASIEEGLEATEDKKDAFLPSVGIVMGNTTTETNLENTLEQKQNLLTREDSSQVNEVQLSSIMKNVSLQNPSIQIEGLKLDKKLSHSSGEVDDAVDAANSSLTEQKFDAKRSASDYELPLNISQSQSESALKHKLTNLTSPVANTTKDLVFSPFSKLARGVQNLGANLDPRKLGQVRHISEREMEEHRKLQEKWQGSKTRLIAL